MRISEGSPLRLGANWDGRGTNFALFSANAEKVELCIFDGQGRREVDRAALPERTEDVWHGYFPEVTPGQLYGYRVHGPYDPENGHRFNSHKLLIDPYAKALAGRLVWSDAHFGYRPDSRRQDLSFDRRDNARGMPKAVVVEEHSASPHARPNIAWEDTIIYEAHVKGLTKLRDDIPAGLRGGYRALAAPQMVDHLRRLGVTTIELLPIHAFVDDRTLVERKLVNYWGYNSIGFFAAEPRYGAADDLRTAIARLHDAGIEVILDVVYNHTAEGNHLGPTLSFRGIDNASYYWLMPEQSRYYDDFTGCGNSLNLTNMRVLQMVMDSLRHWVDVYGVDGFRFDLASTLARGPNGFDQHSSFLTAVRQDPVLSGVKLVAEPWDIGMGGYQVGGFPSQWSEWNDRYRHTMRRFWSGEGHLIGDVGRRMTGSADLFDHNARAPRTSINHVTVHDGFTLADLYSYNDKHNEANGEDNRDGAGDNQSTNCGHEGPTEDAAILDLRRQLRRNQIACLMLAQGVPLLLAGDEVGNSQSGNNNAYCQDNEIGWIDWSARGTPDDMSDFIGRLAAIRRRFSQLTPRHWVQGKTESGFGVLWLTPHATEMTEADWNFPEGRFLAYALAPVGGDGDGATLYIALNAAAEEIEFVLPALPGIAAWQPLLDTGAETEDAKLGPGARAKAAARSVLVFEGSQSNEDQPHDGRS
jgi:glycogen operon protein